MITIENAQLVLKDKNGNVARLQNLGPDDIAKIHNAITDIGKLVDPVSHLPIKATTTTVGVVQLADDKAIAAGTTGRIVDAKQLQDAVLGVSPANCVTNVAAGSTANKITVSKEGGYTTTIVIDNVEHAGTATSANSVAWANVSGKPSTFAPATHNHDSAYLGITAKAVSAKSADSVAWANVSGKPSTFTPSSHTHDDRYYTESEIDTKLNGKANTNHTHSNYLTGITKAMVTTALGYTPPTTDTTYSKLSQFINDTGYITSSGSCNYATTAGNGVDSYGGNWIRFNCGLQICWHLNIEGGSIWTFPKTFTEGRHMCVFGTVLTDEGRPSFVVHTGLNASSVRLLIWDSDLGEWRTDQLCNVMAIGQWK